MYSVVLPVYPYTYCRESWELMCTLTKPPPALIKQDTELNFINLHLFSIHNMQDRNRIQDKRSRLSGVLFGGVQCAMPISLFLSLVQFVFYFENQQLWRSLLQIYGTSSWFTLPDTKPSTSPLQQSLVKDKKENK